MPGDTPFKRPDTEDQGLKGFNYKSEPSSHQRGYKLKPSTPEIRVFAKANVHIHLIGGCDKPRNHGFTIHGHSWQEWPYLGNNSPQMSSQGGISSGFVKTFAFKANSRKGNYMYRSGVLKYAVEQGLWGILRVRPRRILISVPADITPAVVASATLLGLFVRWFIIKKQHKSKG